MVFDAIGRIISLTSTNQLRLNPLARDSYSDFPYSFCLYFDDNNIRQNMNGVTAMDENGEEVKSPIKRLGSTRKLILFNSE